MSRRVILFLIMVLIFGSWADLTGADRFPRPEFDNGYVIPHPEMPVPSFINGWVDTGILLAVLCLASYFVSIRRSRFHLFWLMVFSLVYFGFVRRGCVCSVGSLQNFARSVFDVSYGLPAVVLAFFILPLIFSVYFGRVFCGAVCPLGAIQDIFIMKSVKLPMWMRELFGIFPSIYLGLAVLFAATGSGFIICRMDPFVSFFRLSGDFKTILVGVFILVVGIFIARPYCRFICPYGVLLSWLSKLKKNPLSPTPSECVGCGLCLNSCPFQAISPPSPEKDPETLDRGVKRIAVLIVLMPFIVVSFAFAGRNLSGELSRLNPTVKLAEALAMENAVGESVQSPDTLAFRSAGGNISNLYVEADKVRGKFILGSTILGAFVGLSFFLAFFRLSRRPRRDRFEADRSRCLGCGRCYDYCPVEIKRKKSDQPGGKL